MVPVLSDIYLNNLLEKMNLEQKNGIYINVDPDINAELYECIPNVRNRIKVDGGQEILGWEIWKTNILIEAQFHSVWKSEDNVLFDITPREKEVEVEKILFFPDKRLIYDGFQKDNIRCNITKNRLVDDFIQLVETQFKIQNRRAEKYTHERILNENESHNYKAIEVIKTHIYQMIKNGLTRNSNCFCGVAKKYKHCHGKSINKDLKKL